MKEENNRYLSTVFTGVAAGMICGCCILGGCSNEAGLTADPTGVPLGVESLKLDAGTANTRAGGTPVTTDGAAIKVFLTGSGGYSPVYDKTYTYASASGTWGSTDPVYVDNRPGKAVAVYAPDNVVSFTAGSCVSNEPLQAQAYAENKLWYYDNTSGESVNNVSPPVAFSMKCAYARLKFSITRVANYKKDCKVSRIVMQPTAGEFYTKAPVDIVTGNLQMAGATPATSLIIDSSTLRVNTIGIAVDKTNTDIDWLFPGQQLATGAGLSFRLTIDGDDRTITVPASRINNGNIEAGRQITINLKITDTAVTLNGNIDVADWVTDGTVIQNDKPIRLEGIYVPYDEIGMGNKHCSHDDKKLLSRLRWAGGNLRQQNYDGSGPTIMAGPTEHGHYYTWMSEYTGNTTSNGKDPCKSLDAAKYGTGWRTPSADEFDALARCTDGRFIDGGMWFLNNPNGIFLRGAGYRNNNEGCGPPLAEEVIRSTGYYWSSDKNRYNGLMLSFVQGGGYVQNYSVNGGMQIRCVTGKSQ